MDLFKQVTALAKRRGFIFPGSEIYGGLANTYDYGPLGVELLRNLRNYWWEFFVSTRENIYGLETSVLMNPKVWEASGHTSSFTDALIECKQCHTRTRADHLIEDKLKTKVEGKSLAELNEIITTKKIACPACGQFNWTEAKKFNLLFETHIGIVPENKSLAYLRGETAQGMFVDFKQILDTFAPKLPFGLAQSGKVFRNEITKGQQVFRTLEFDLAEFEYYIDAKTWEKEFEYWQSEIEKFAVSLGVNKKKLKWRAHDQKELAHYSKRTEDLEYEFPFGFKEWFACAYRTDFDLKNHMEKSGVDLRYTDPYTQEKFIPHVIEPTFGLSRSILVLLTEAYTEEKDRVVLKLTPRLAPFKVAVFPLLPNKPELVTAARQVFKLLSPKFTTAWDDGGNIGKRYRRQDEAGTPWCITVDFDSLKDKAVTVRDRDTMKQERIKIDQLVNYFQEKL
ncbi:MAG: glycine--tRNA ligase [Patescibacteria group bacterium]